MIRDPDDYTMDCFLKFQSAPTFVVEFNIIDYHQDVSVSLSNPKQQSQSFFF